jgi:hypothetical protein
MMQVTRAAFQVIVSLNLQATDPKSHTLASNFYTRISLVPPPGNSNGRPWRRLPPYYRSVIDQFDALYADSRKHSRVMGIPLHPMLIGQRLRIKYLQQAIAYMKKHERVWFATAGEIVDAYELANPVS